MMKVYGPLFGMMIAFIVVFVVGLIWYVKKAASGSILCYFVEERSSFSKMLKEDVLNKCVWLGADESQEKYLVDENKIFWMWWPGQLPRIFQVPVRVMWYQRRNPTPFDPSKPHSNITARALRIAQDEVFLRAMWKDLRETTGGVKGIAKVNQYLLMGIVAVACLCVVLVYMDMSMSKVVKANAASLNAIMQYFKITIAPVVKK